MGNAFRQRPQHNGTVRHGFIPRHPRFATQLSARLNNKGYRFGHNLVFEKIKKPPPRLPGIGKGIKKLLGLVVTQKLLYFTQLVF